MSLLPSFQKILVPTDLSETSAAALRRALDMARRADGAVTLLHVYHLPPYELSDDTVEKIAGAARASVDALARQCGDAGVPVTAVVLPGSPAEVIVDYARHEGMDLIALGTHGRTGLKHILLGSVAERVVRFAGCPVLTIRG